MTLNDAFHNLAVEQIERALDAEVIHGFPQDVFGLARLLLRTFSILATDCSNSNASFTSSQEVDLAIERRISAMLQLEQLHLDHLDGDDCSDLRPRDTRH